jgi:hypothetical protein
MLKLFLAINTFFVLLSMTADAPRTAIIDDFTNTKNWTAQVINSQQFEPIFRVGLWSDPVKDASYSVQNGKAFFHFPKLESWQVQGFEYAWHTEHHNQAFPLFDSANYLYFNIISQSSEPVKLKWRLLEDLQYVYSGNGPPLKEDGMVQMLCSPDTLVIYPNKPQKVRIKLSHTSYLGKDKTLSRFMGGIRFFCFEVNRTLASSKTKPTIACTLIMDKLRIEDGKVN